MAMAYGSDTRRHRLPAVLRAPFEARTWREFGYLLLGLPLSLAYFCIAITLMSVGVGLVVTFVGIPLLAAALAVCRAIGTVERARARALLGMEIASPAPVAGGPGKGLMSWVGGVLKSGESWRHLLYTLIHMPWSVFAFSVAVSFWAYGWAFATYPLWRWVFPVFAGQGGLQLYGDTEHSVYLDSVPEIAATSLVGVGLVLVSPWVIRALALVDRGLVIGLLSPSRLASRVSE
ncbi:sensor domain-containing protein, partial [Streptomyces sp. ODS05-4]|uniref:sensor domain-containing protein n=1 Tax=Streptomyces sp. ODS05-4 TaxID=2944939 RepID=UPI00210B0AF9